MKTEFVIKERLKELEKLMYNVIASYKAIDSTLMNYHMMSTSYHKQVKFIRGQIKSLKWVLKHGKD